MLCQRRSLILGVTAISAGLAGCPSSLTGSGETDSGEGEGGGNGDNDASVAVIVGFGEDQVFHPEGLLIETGTRVRFIWEQDGHTLSVVDKPEDAEWEGVVEPQERGYTHENTFDTSGDYEIQCDQHSGEDEGLSIIVGDNLELMTNSSSN